MVVKLPFVTNCEVIKFRGTFDAILDRFEILLKHCSHLTLFILKSAIRFLMRWFNRDKKIELLSKTSKAE